MRSTNRQNKQPWGLKEWKPKLTKTTMGSRWFCWSTLLLPMIGGQQRVFLKPEEPGEVTLSPTSQDFFCKTFCDNYVILSHVLLKTDHTFERCKEAWCAPPCPAWSPACPTTSTLPAPAGSRAPGPPSAWQGSACQSLDLWKSDKMILLRFAHRLDPSIYSRRLVRKDF